MVNEKEAASSLDGDPIVHSGHMAELVISDRFRTATSSDSISFI